MSSNFRIAEGDAEDLVSIVIPVFNGANYLADAIDSALAQSWHAVEVIVVDDGSNDGGKTRAIAQSYGERIRFVSKENGGVATALNAGIAAMRGRWFSWLSHDDLYLPRKVEEQVTVLRKAGPGCFAFSDFELMDASGTVVHRQSPTSGFDPDQPLWAVLEGRINGCTMMLPREMLQAAGGFDPHLPTTQDYELWFRLLRRHRLLPVPGALVRQRMHPGQHSRDPRHLDEASLLWAEMLTTITAEEMRRHAANETAFLRRAARHVAGGPYPGAPAVIASLIAERIRDTKVSVVWAGGGVPSPGRGPRAVAAVVAEAGLSEAGVVVADVSPDAPASMALREVAGRDAQVYRAWSEEGLPPVLECGRSGRGSVLLLADAATRCDAARLREAVAMIEAGEAEGVLDPAADAGGDGALPPACRGAVLSAAALDAALGRRGGSDGLELLAGLRLATLPHPGNPSETSGAPGPAEPAATTVPQPPNDRRLSLVHSRPGRVVLAAAHLLHHRVPPLRGRIGERLARLFGAEDFVDGPAYLARNPDLAAARVDPFLHYMLIGAREGRHPRPGRPSLPAFAEPPSAPARSEEPQRDRSRPARLLILHAVGGGTRRYAELLRKDLERRGERVVLAWGERDETLVLEGADAENRLTEFVLPGQLEQAAAALRGLGVTRADVLHAFGIETQLVPLLNALGVPYDVTFLDYYLVAVNPHLLDANGRTDAVGGTEGEAASLRRSTPHPVIQGAGRLLACSQDLASRIERLVPGLSVQVVRPPERPDPSRYRVTPFRCPAAEEKLRILFLGVPAPHKGGDILLDTAALAARRGAPLEFHALGDLPTPIAPARQSPATLRLHGQYEAGDLNRLVCALRPHVAWFPAMAPETYGFALSDAMLLGLPIVARGMGAYPERLKGRPHTCVVRPDEDHDAEAWLRRLLALRSFGFGAAGLPRQGTSGESIT